MTDGCRAPVTGTRAGSSSGALAGIYLVAFLVAVNQFVPLLGERGLLPVRRFVSEVPFRASPSLFFLRPERSRVPARGLGRRRSSRAIALSGFPQRRSALAAAAMWGALWLLYLSFVNVGQTFYGSAGNRSCARPASSRSSSASGTTAPHVILNWIYRWTLFRLMFGAGLIKMRGDPCWRDLTCLDYYFETQPIPNR